MNRSTPAARRGRARRGDLGAQQRRILAAVLDVDAHGAGVHQRRHQVADARRVVRVAALDVDCHRQVDRAGDGARRLQQQLDRQQVAVGPAVRPGDGGAAGGDRARAGRLREARAAGVPGVGQAQQAVGVQRVEACGEGGEGGVHAVSGRSGGASSHALRRRSGRIRTCPCRTIPTRPRAQVDGSAASICRKPGPPSSAPRRAVPGEKPTCPHPRK